MVTDGGKESAAGTGAKVTVRGSGRAKVTVRGNGRAKVTVRGSGSKTSEIPKVQCKLSRSVY